MNAYVVTRPGETAFLRVNVPKPGDYEALVRIESCTICNTTDRMIIKGTFPFEVRYPCVLGHESIGTVIEVGKKVTSFRVGDRVTRAGYRPDAGEGGLHTAWGGFAAYGIAEDVAAKKRDGLAHGYEKQAPQVIPADIPARDAALFVCLGETSSFARQLGDLRGKHVAVIGTGVAGYAIAFFAKQFGAARVTVVGRRNERLQLAARLGADHVLNISESQNRERTIPAPMDIIVEASGNHAALTQTLEYLKHDGMVAVYGLAERAYEFPLHRGPRSFSVRQIQPDETAMISYLTEMSRDRRLPADLLITHEWKFEELDDAFRQVDRGEVVKGIVWLTKNTTS
jgi:2-desacetyl-2-hydroxyethyl bacteriochlorophyllide A dehydrogenase